MQSKMELNMSNNLYCEMCSIQFGKKIVYDTHMSFVHKKEQSELMKALIKKETEGQDIDCSNKKYKEGLISCSICQVSFSIKSSLKRHIEAVHEGTKAHKCSICDYTSSYKDKLKRHIEAVHGGKKPHKCSICDFNTSYKHVLKKHIEAVHEEKKPHKCSICDSNFSSTGALTDGIFETGAYGVPSKSQNPTDLGQGGPFSTQCSNPSWA